MNRHARRVAATLIVSAAAVLTVARLPAETSQQADPDSGTVDANEEATEDGDAAEELFQTRADERIADEVRKLLMNDPKVQIDDLQVDVEGGIVTLEGRVGSIAERQLAGGHAGAVPGVQGIANLLRVAPDLKRGAPPPEPAQ
jgi:osmotically-inducible protein OsmY